ncbi:histone H3.3-like [Contarinia nasturtii]|uniref:histone H3.3-like n=1 Tax=Contarinia nasturtii TaxID=265458 RepID=UPI0012D45C2D|nr:histone H3.3-like [Contarinia nasturtii]
MAKKSKKKPESYSDLSSDYFSEDDWVVIRHGTATKNDLVFKNIVHDILFRENVFSMQVNAIEALQEAAEGYIVELFHDAVTCAIHGGTTVLLEDLILALRFRH